jgi:hypothetical protein
MKHSILLTLGAAALTLTSQAQISFSGSYSNNFDGLGPTGTTYDAGWSAVRTNDGAALTLSVSTGTSTAGGIYNVGTAGETDRALGSLASSTTVPRFGAQLQNVTGALITDLTLSGVMEQWRTGGSATTDEVITFEYSLNAADINDPVATWVAVAGLDLNERLTSSTSGGAVNGNLPENQLNLSTAISGINWSDDGVLTLRWSDHDHTGSDGMYAIDNLSVSTVPEPSTWALLVLGALGLVGKRFRR